MIGLAKLLCLSILLSLVASSRTALAQTVEDNLGFIEKILDQVDREDMCTVLEFKEVEKLKTCFDELREAWGETFESKLTPDQKLLLDNMLYDWENFHNLMKESVVIKSVKTRRIKSRIEKYQAAKSLQPACSGQSDIKGPIANHIYEENPHVRWLKYVHTGQVVDPPEQLSESQTTEKGEATEPASQAEEGDSEAAQQAEEEATNAAEIARQAEKEAAEAARKAEEEAAKAAETVRQAEEEAARKNQEEKEAEAARLAKEEAAEAIKQAEKEATQQAIAKANEAALQTEARAAKAETRATEAEKKASEALKQAQARVAEVNREIQAKAAEVEAKAADTVKEAEAKVTEAEKKAADALRRAEDKSEEAAKVAIQAKAKAIAAQAKAARAVEKARTKVAENKARALEKIRKAEAMAADAIRQANTIVDEAEARAIQAEARADEADARTAQAETRASEAELRAAGSNMIEGMPTESVNKTGHSDGQQQTGIQYSYVGKFTIDFDNVPDQITIKFNLDEDINRDPLGDIPVPVSTDSEDDNKLTRADQGESGNDLVLMRSDELGAEYGDDYFDEADFERLVRVPKNDWKFDPVYRNFKWPDECGNQRNSPSQKLDQSVLLFDGSWYKFTNDPLGHHLYLASVEPTTKKPRVNYLAAAKELAAIKKKEARAATLRQESERLFGKDTSDFSGSYESYMPEIKRDRWTKLLDNKVCRLSYNKGAIKQKGRSSVRAVKKVGTMIGSAGSKIKDRAKLLCGH